MKVSGQLHALAALPHGNNPGAHWIGGWVGPRAGLGFLIQGLTISNTLTWSRTARGLRAQFPPLGYVTLFHSDKYIANYIYFKTSFPRCSSITSNTYTINSRFIKIFSQGPTRNAILIQQEPAYVLIHWTKRQTDRLGQATFRSYRWSGVVWSSCWDKTNKEVQDWLKHFFLLAKISRPTCPLLLLLLLFLLVLRTYHLNTIFCIRYICDTHVTLKLRTVAMFLITDVGLYRIFHADMQAVYDLHLHKNATCVASMVLQ
jgi:hypothetical protein